MCRCIVLAEDARHADQLEAEIGFFSGGDVEVLHFVEWETLPWDSFSPHQDIVSQRLSVIVAHAIDQERRYRHRLRGRRYCNGFRRPHYVALPVR